MNVRAKFFVSEVKHAAVPGSEPYATVTLAPVFGSYGDGEDNKTWAKYTPCGKIELGITNPAAIEAFELGKAYLITFEPAE